VSRVVLASENPGKLRELEALLAPYDLEVVPQSAFDVCAVEETGLTFVENAILKARNAARVSGLAAIADDSGIAVDILDGAPGVHSARYAGPGATDEQNLEKLLEAMRGVPASERGARYLCVAVYLAHARDPSPIVCEGTWEGHIGETPRGRHGFGYDPVFLVPGHDCTAAELDPAAKNAISHRAKAMQCLIARLATR